MVLKQQIHYYDTVTEAIEDLRKRGYTVDLELLKDSDCYVCKHTTEQLSPDEFEIDETYRFEGDSDPGDEMIVYAVSSKKSTLKGIIVNAYGMYSDSSTYRMVEHLQSSVEKTVPIKRSKFLKPLSREHHHGLLLSWKLREGARLQVQPERMKRYADWFWTNYLQAHFEFEESFIFPILGNDNPLAKRALHEHDGIKKLLSRSDDLESVLSVLQKELDAHIRFEERILFKEVEEKASTEQMAIIEKEFVENKVDEWPDAFWLANPK